MKTINLTKNYSTIVSDVDHERLSQYHWYASINRSKFVRAYRHENGKNISMARQIVGALPGQVVDHINSNTLDNRRENLRTCTLSGNNHNRSLDGRNKSGFKGVYWNPKSSKWQASICVSYKQKHLGCFKDKTDAARAYDKAAATYFGEFAKLNFP